MTPRLEQLLARYPLDLDEAELAELRRAAESDPTLDRAMDEALELDAELDGVTIPEPAPLSDRAQRRIEVAERAARAWTSGPAAPVESSASDRSPASPQNDAPRAWTSGPAAPVESRADNVVPLFRRPAFMAIAAMLLVALGVLVGRGIDPYQGGIKGDPTGTMEGQLILQAVGEPRLVEGDSRPANQPIRITARLEDQGSLALVEVQGGVGALVWPLPGSVWLADVGPNLLSPPGAAPEYRPAAAGEATYVLLGRKDRPLVLTERRPVTVEGLLDANEGAVELDRITVRWTPAEGSE